MPMSADMVTALDAPVIVRFFACEIVLPDYTLRLLDGASQVTFDGRTFVGEDPTYGTLGQVQAITEGLGTEAPRMRMPLYPPTLAACARLNQMDVQGSPVTAWWGVCDPVSGVVLPDPEVMFVGEIDLPKYLRGKGKRAVELDCCSAWEFLFVQDEGQRLNDAHQQTIDPTDRGLEYVSEVERQLPWGADAPRSPMVSSRGSTGYGGGGGGGGGRGGGGGGYLDGTGGIGGNPYGPIISLLTGGRF